MTPLRFGVLLVAIPFMTIPVAAGCLCFNGPVTDYEQPIAPYERPPDASYEPRSIAPYAPQPIAPYAPRPIAPRYYVGNRPAPMHHIAKHSPLPQQRDEKAPPARPPPALPLRERLRG